MGSTVAPRWSWGRCPPTRYGAVRLDAGRADNGRAHHRGEEDAVEAPRTDALREPDELRLEAEERRAPRASRLGF